ncbi:MAG TPA: DUF3099 domain-containing protein [Lapillicoccus sp.]
MRRGEDEEQSRRAPSRPSPPPVQSVTSAPVSAADDQGHRVRRYLLTMGIRVVCGALALFTEGWVRWTFVALAVVLPYIAVVMANAVGPRSGEVVAPVDHEPPAALPTSRVDDEGRTIHGRVVDS